MDGYHIALFVHLFALLVAVGVSALVHFALHRRAHARTVGETLEWHLFIAKAARLFPAALLVLVLTGSYMITAAGVRPWSTGFVVAGLTGAALLLANGGVLAARGRILRQRLEQTIGEEGAEQPSRIPPDTLVNTLADVNIGIVLAVVFDMSVKPGVAAALGLVGLGIALSVAVSLVVRAQPAANEVPA